MVFKASAPGKIILTGEHAVVYKKPAIAASVDIRLEVELNIGYNDLQPGIQLFF